MVFQKRQFSPIGDGRYYEQVPTELTKKAVDEAYREKDTTKGALFFSAEYSGMWKTWNQTYAYLFTDEVGHMFYKLREE